MKLTNEKIKAMLEDIIIEVNYTIFKMWYSKETSKYPNEVDDNYKVLIDIVKKHLVNKSTVCPLCKGMGTVPIPDTKNDLVFELEESENDNIC